jgi:hypothetical protein
MTLTEKLLMALQSILVGLIVGGMAIAFYCLAHRPAPQRMCIDGVMMEKQGDAMVQSGAFGPIRCMPISKD